jgi:dTDP-4-amino-4,6-dideoxygalactose transaminase
MSEVNAALGLLQLKHVDQAIARRSEVESAYRRLLASVPGLRMLDVPADTQRNHSYFPILVEPAFGASRDDVYDALKAQNVFARRYFYPLISDFPMYRGLPSATAANLSVSRAMADRVLCLPIYPSLTDTDIDYIAGIVRNAYSGTQPT